MRKFARLMAVGGALGTAIWAVPAITQQAATPPIARYTVDAGTLSGMAAMAGGRPDMMALMRGRGGGPQHELRLRLGSSRKPADAPVADHFMPAGAGLGASVALVTPVREPVPEAPTGFEMPKGKLYLFWGCGEHAPAGQPVVIDLAKLARGQVPPDLYASGIDLPGDWTITPANSVTYGEWPNGRDHKAVSAAASLLGAHRVAGNFAPEIAFPLNRDFMPPLQLRSQALPSGAWSVSWTGLPEATGYYAWAMGAKDMGRGGANEMVWWTSAATRQFGGTLWDWVSPGAAARLVAAKTAMAPGQTSCTVPAEVRQLGGEMLMLNLTAYGPQSDFAYPPRHANARLAWKPEWIARVRFRSRAMVMLGMPDMSGMGAGDSADQDRGSTSQPQSGKPKCSKGLKGMAMRAAGRCE